MDRSWERTRGFDAYASDYALARPSYPERAVRWLVGEAPVRVLEVGAGSGQMTGALLQAGHEVVALDRSSEILGQLASRLDVPVVRGVAERLPFHAGAFDVVVAAESFHWFDPLRTLPELARVLRTGGRLSLVWNTRDESVPWVRRLTSIIDAEPDDLEEITASLPLSGLFGLPESSEYGFWQQLDLDALLALVASRSSIAARRAAERDHILAQVAGLYESHASGHNGLRMRYATRCFRAEVHKDALNPGTVARELRVDLG
ncbi:class I SAM-dependent methyltransferase [Mumia sp. zg.B17]|uniref:class I SAM-dependent methyltransferase n=1 Tax=Mumia sp. zg.B17 TaxID=2855446 RepID=UPI001C6DD4B3|nr:class I SAM-dependent methyltransferase [Mumia sp. zg.B17]MBW9207414.1 class I SAM-dependent methyltransferase [Mumia sp. zg.B17]